MENTQPKPYGIIYVVQNLVNGKLYVGQTTSSLRRRWISGHVSAAFAKRKKEGVSPLHSAILKYGDKNFFVRQICSADTQEVLDSLETLWIRLLDTCDNNLGYNIRFGGNGGGKLSEEAKRKARRPRSEEAKARMRGRKFSEEHIANLKEAHKEYWSSLKGKRPVAMSTPEAKAKATETKIANQNTWSLSEETKTKMRKPKSPEHRAKLSAHITALNKARATKVTTQ